MKMLLKKMFEMNRTRRVFLAVWIPACILIFAFIFGMPGTKMRVPGSPLSTYTLGVNEIISSIVVVCLGSLWLYIVGGYEPEKK